MNNNLYHIMYVHINTHHDYFHQWILDDRQTPYQK